MCVFVLQPVPEMFGESILSFTPDCRAKNLCGESKGWEHWGCTGGERKASSAVNFDQTLAALFTREHSRTHLPI